MLGVLLGVLLSMLMDMMCKMSCGMGHTDRRRARPGDGGGVGRIPERMWKKARLSIGRREVAGVSQYEVYCLLIICS